jgi:predicted DNA-binding protein with PD1-like motif
MDWMRSSGEVFIRIDNGEPLVATLIRASQEMSIRVAAIASGVGMLKDVELGFFDADSDSYKTARHVGPFDLSVVTGSVVPREDHVAAHVHAVFNNQNHATYSGHVVEARCHVTVELFLSITDLPLKREKLAKMPASRITIEGSHDKKRE